MEEKRDFKSECLPSRQADDSELQNSSDHDEIQPENFVQQKLEDSEERESPRQSLGLAEENNIVNDEGSGKPEYPIGAGLPTSTTEKENLVESNPEYLVDDNMQKRDNPESMKSQSHGTGDIGDNPHVLDPENPLMIKFQQALTDLLKKQLNKLSQEVAELKSNLKMKAKEREDLGVNLFNIQEEVSQSQKQISSCKMSLTELEEKRASIEEDLKKNRNLHKQEVEKISHAHAQEENMRLEIEILKSVEWQLKQWESDYNSELAISQRIADKSEKQKEEMAREKQKQDILLLKLRQAVLGLESKREQLKAQREVKIQQQESLRRTIAEGTADLEALQTEQIRLTRIWNGVVINLQQRDKVYNNVQKELEKAKEAFQLMISEIEGYKRLARHEMVQNEKTMSILDHLEAEYNDLMKTHCKNKELITELEADYSYISGILKSREENLQSVLVDGKILTQQSLYKQKEVEHLTQKKIMLETQILEKLQDQSKHDKAFQHLAKTIKNLKDSNKNQELTFIMMENQISKTMVEVEKIRGATVYNESLIIEANNELGKYGNDLSQLEAGVKRSLSVMENKMQLIDQLSKKLNSILARSGMTEESPQEVRIKAIELEIEETAVEAEKKQAFWLRLQSHIVRLTEERQKQLQQLNLLYKQVHILTQRSLKIEHEMEKHNRGKKDIEHQIHELDVSLNKMTVGLHNRRGYKEILDKENLIIQTEALGLLKDLERENVEQEEELTNLEEINLMLNQDILDMKRDCLAWEKKILLATETKQMNEEDNKANGELGQMKVEIHRMDVRFSHLRKVQETLVKDLEHCIMRRESLLNEADAREKRSTGCSGSTSNRIVFERKLENLSSRKKQANLEAKNVASQLEKELPQQLTEIKESLVEAEKGLQREEQALQMIKKQVDEAHAMKQQKLETLVRLQKKVRLYSKVKEGKHKLLYRTESGLDAEICKQRTVTSNLLDLKTVLQQHFPSLNAQVLRLGNILQSPNTQ
ncbi:coiled-coil domain-containing protein 40 [Frankliniella occidentalis]|uniref:Coiled-coil domain-containing protein 40 n=1 Tax=Frankliniella occidentalis TaxID=133901 RepID=A0A6J1SU13_FRAOC|nr:coiled-coil domain-containing protein 40 [Frankliniella occidentalis]